MAVYEKIRDRLMPGAKGILVSDVRIGLGYTAVLLENGQAGVALTFHKEAKKGCTVYSSLFPLAGREASELLPFLESSDPVETAVGLATANALNNTMKMTLREGDSLEIISIQPEDKVGMVGFFGPMLPRLKKRTSSISIFERVPEKQGDLLPEKEAYRVLPQCQVALITSTSILNHTVDSLLEAAAPCREVVLLGASTPLLPEAFAGTHVTCLSGIVVTVPKDILRIVSEGRGMKYFKDSTKKVNLRLKETERNCVF